VSPRTLAEVAQDTLDGESFGMSLANFLDGFYFKPAGEALLETPATLKGKVEEGEVKDAYLAATAEELARRYKYKMPEWIWEEERKLHRPWFAPSPQSIRGILILESPVGFRSRNLFVSENALSRA
jgi:hypothetical protein